MAAHSGSSGSSPPKGGELVLLDYDLWSESGGKSELIDTTRIEVAQLAQFSLPTGYEFGARPHLLGGDELPAALESAIVAAPTGQEIEKEFAPAEAFGERDPKLIELFSMHEIERLPEMRREDAELRIGTVLNLRGRRGRVISYTAARVRVDFNPPYAGRKIRLKFKVLHPVTEPTEKARALIDLTYGRGKDFHVELHEKVLSITVPDRAKFDLAWHAAAKSRLIERLRSQLHPKSIHFVEEYATPAPKESKAASESKAEKAESAEEKPPAKAETPVAHPGHEPHHASAAAGSKR